LLTPACSNCSVGGCNGSTVAVSHNASTRTHIKALKGRIAHAGTTRREKKKKKKKKKKYSRRNIQVPSRIRLSGFAWH
jgi:hypothetical protein